MTLNVHIQVVLNCIEHFWLQYSLRVWVSYPQCSLRENYPLIILPGTLNLLSLLRTTRFREIFLRIHVSWPFISLHGSIKSLLGLLYYQENNPHLSSWLKFSIPGDINLICTLTHAITSFLQCVDQNSGL